MIERAQILQQADFCLAPLPTADLDYLRSLTQIYKDNPDLPLERFFSQALLGFYDAMWSHLTKEAGDIIYRLSDFVDEEEREKMPIYPSISDDPEYRGSLRLEDGGYSHTLEDFRRAWEKYHPEGIPFFRPQLP